MSGIEIISTNEPKRPNDVVAINTGNNTEYTSESKLDVTDKINVSYYSTHKGPKESNFFGASAGVGAMLASSLVSGPAFPILFFGGMFLFFGSIFSSEK